MLNSFKKYICIRPIANVNAKIKGGYQTNIDKDMVIDHLTYVYINLSFPETDMESHFQEINN